MAYGSLRDRARIEALKRKLDSGILDAEEWAELGQLQRSQSIHGDDFPADTSGRNGAIGLVGVAVLLAALYGLTKFKPGAKSEDKKDNLGDALLRAARTALPEPSSKISDGDAGWSDITGNGAYYERGHGTTCGVFLAYLLEKAGAPAEFINRNPPGGSGFKIGWHITKMHEAAQKLGVLRTPTSGQLPDLVPGMPYATNKPSVDKDGKPLDGTHVGLVSSVDRVGNALKIETVDGGWGTPEKQTAQRNQRVVSLSDGHAKYPNGDVIPTGVVMIYTPVLGTTTRLDWWIDLRGIPAGDAATKQPEPMAAAKNTMPDDNRVVGPAYPYLSKWTAAERASLLSAQKKLGLDVSKGALPGVIQHESGGDPTVPHQATGTPRGGLIQITTGANLPGFKTADEAWGARKLSIVDQLEKIVVPLWSRFGNLSDATFVTMMRKNFLPGVASKPAGFVLGVRPEGNRGTDGNLLPGELDAGVGPNGEKPDDKLMAGIGLTLGQIYNSNPGFDPGKKRGYFTWATVDADAERTTAKSGGKWITVSGKIVASPDGSGAVSHPPSTPASPAPMAIAREPSVAAPTKVATTDHMAHFADPANPAPMGMDAIDALNKPAIDAAKAASDAEYAKLADAAIAANVSGVSNGLPDAVAAAFGVVST